MIKSITSSPPGRFIPPSGLVYRKPLDGSIQTYPPEEDFFTAAVLKKLDAALPLLRERGIPPIKLHIGAPTEPPPAGVLNKLTESASRPDVHTYADPKGEKVFRDAIETHMRNRYGVVIDPETQVRPAQGSCPVIYFAMRDLITNPGIVIVPTPGYPPFSIAAEIGKHQVFGIPLTPENNFMPDLALALEYLQRNGVASNVRAVVINYPHNPTCAVADLGYLEKVVDLAKKYKFKIISDMAYGEAYDPNVPADKRPHSIFEIQGANEVDIIEPHSLGKTFNATGWRIAFVVFSTVDTVNQNTGETAWNKLAAPWKPFQYATAHGLTDAECLKSLEERNQEYAERYKLMTDGLKKLGWKIHDYDRGGFFLWGQDPDPRMTSEEFADELLLKTGIVVVPGKLFGDEGEGFFRASLMQPKDTLREALNRLEKNGFRY